MINNFKKALKDFDNKKITSVYNEKGIIIRNIDKNLKKIFIKNINKI